MFSRSQDLSFEIFKSVLFTIFPVFLGLALLNGCANPRDRQAALDAAARIHSQIRSGNFASIYDESANGFKTVDRVQFVAWMSELRNKLGPVKNLKEIAYQTGLDSRAGATHALVFDVQFEGERIRETLIFVRGDDHTMRLWKLGIEPVD